jgi:hypothetical protein
MADRLKRREFIKNVSLAGASIAITDVVAANSNNGDEIKNEWFTISFDSIKERSPSTGTMEMLC